MTRLSLTINGTPREIEVEPRLSLVDYLRDHASLTGTHVGCEHGVCGACTVIIDGAPARSCITFAAACEGAEITTIEGLEDDLVVAELRTAFRQRHGLQCGYCTPAMLIAARDIVTRLPDADEARIRLELSGNLCRCTGYVGIVEAIVSVMEKHRDAPLAAPPAREKLGPLGSHPPAQRSDAGETAPPIRHATPKADAQSTTDLATEDWAAVDAQGVELTQSFEVGHPRDEVWHFLADLDRVARCMPGARLTTPPTDGRAQGEIVVKLGPITSAFAGQAEIERDDANYSAVVHGAGRDSKSASRARAIITYHVDAVEDDRSRVAVSVKFLLAGALAQFSRSGLVRNVADHLTATFAGNLEAQLSGAPAAETAAALDASAIARAAFWDRFVAFIRRLFGR